MDAVLSHVSKDALNGLLALAKAEGFFTMPARMIGHGLPDVGGRFITMHTASGVKSVHVRFVRNAAFDQLYAVLMAAEGIYLYDGGGRHRPGGDARPRPACATSIQRGLAAECRRRTARRSSSRRIRYRCSGDHAALIMPPARRPWQSASRCRRPDDAIDAGRRHTEVALGLQ